VGLPEIKKQQGRKFSRITSGSYMHMERKQKIKKLMMRKVTTS